MQCDAMACRNVRGENPRLWEGLGAGVSTAKKQAKLTAKDKVLAARGRIRRLMLARAEVKSEPVQDLLGEG